MDFIIFRPSDLSAILAKQTSIPDQFVEPWRQINTATKNEKGTVDKAKGSYDLYDALIMAVWGLKAGGGCSVLVNEGMAELRTHKHEQSQSCCIDCNNGNHMMEPHRVYMFDESEQSCKCETCTGIKPKAMPKWGYTRVV